MNLPGISSIVGEASAVAFRERLARKVPHHHSRRTGYRRKVIRMIYAPFPEYVGAGACVCRGTTAAAIHRMEAPGDAVSSVSLPTRIHPGSVYRPSAPIHLIPFFPHIQLSATQCGGWAMIVKSWPFGPGWRSPRCPRCSSTGDERWPCICPSKLNDAARYASRSPSLLAESSQIWLGQRYVQLGTVVVGSRRFCSGSSEAAKIVMHRMLGFQQSTWYYIFLQQLAVQYALQDGRGTEHRRE
jgi:hypothetical protein